MLSAQPQAVINTRSGQLPLRTSPACTPHLRSCSRICGHRTRCFRGLLPRIQLQPPRTRAVRCYSVLTIVPIALRALTESQSLSFRSTKAQASGTDGVTPSSNGASPIAEVCAVCADTTACPSYHSASSCPLTLKPAVYSSVSI